MQELTDWRNAPSVFYVPQNAMKTCFLNSLLVFVCLSGAPAVQIDYIINSF